jgi:hypothetical protein
MGPFVRCPLCGSKQQVSEDRIGKRVRCAGCEEVFAASLAEGGAQAKPRSARKPNISPRLPWFRRVIGDPSAAVDGSIPGAFSGVLAGVLGALVAGVVSMQAPGTILGVMLLGFVIGFAIGTLLGALLGVCVKHFHPDFHFYVGWASALGGAVIGTIVVTFVENFRWVPIGAGFGALGFNLWLLFCTRVETTLNSPTPPASEGEESLDAADESSMQKSSHHSGA